MQNHTVEFADANRVNLVFAGIFNVTVPLLDRHVANGHDFTVAQWRDRKLAVSELADNVNRTANLLISLGVKPGDRVLITVRDSAQFYYAFLGAVRLGAVAVPVNYFQRTKDYEYLLKDSGARAVFMSSDAAAEVVPALDAIKDRPPVLISTDADLKGWIHLGPAIDTQPAYCEPAPTSSESDCFWLYSSGSTGSPKGCVHKHADLIHVANLYGEKIAGVGSGTIMLSPAKLFFAYGIGNSICFPLWLGATTVLLEERPNAALCLDAITHHKPTHFFGVPTLYVGMIAALENGHQADLSSLKFCVTGGEILPSSMADQWRKLTGCELYEGIGSSEALHYYTSNSQQAFRKGTAGRLVPGYEGRIVDDEGQELAADEVGQFAVAGPSLFKGYWNKPEKTAEVFRGKWFLTGDMCSRDRDGYFSFHGRGNDMLKVGGIWVSPAELESALITHPAVHEAAVIGSPDESGLIKPNAFVVLKNGVAASSTLENELKAFMKARLAPYKFPRSITFVDDLPRTVTGKIQRFRLRATTPSQQ